MNDEDLEVALALLMPQNRLIMQVAIHTGLRIGDVVELRSEQIGQRFTVKERKTGKSRRVSLPMNLRRRIMEQAGEVWAFPGRKGSALGHKSRQAVWQDIKRAGRAMRLPANIGTHTARKVFAVRKLQATGNLGAVQRALNHDDMAVTMLYAMADHLGRQQAREGTRKRCRPN